jgi:hypothetical protein
MKIRDAKRQSFWDDNGSYEHWYNRALWEERNERFSDKIKKPGYYEAKRMGLIPEYHPGRSYTRNELEWMADFTIFEHPSYQPDGTILSEGMWKSRLKHEIYSTRGTPDPNIVSGLYWRTHPQGLKWRTKEERKELKATFYKY